MSRWYEIQSNQKLRENLVKRDFIIRAMREWFYREEFIEVETPRIIKHPGMEPYLNPFNTTLYNEKNAAYPAHLITSPEYSMKKLLASGFSKIFDIGKVFRNGESFGGTHNPEFTLVEWYRAGVDYFELMEDCEKMIMSVMQQILDFDPTGHLPQEDKFSTSSFKLKYQKRLIDISLPWDRMSMKEAFKKYCQLNLDELLDVSSIKKLAEDRGYKIGQDFRYEDIFFKIFLNEIEPHLGKDRPVFLYDYPSQMGALARRKKSDTRYVERVELYIGELEIANGFSELTDLDEQKKRFEEEQTLRKELGKEVYDIDEGFISALRDMPESAGIALGVDRLVMLLLDARSIDEVLCFPASFEFGKTEEEK